MSDRHLVEGVQEPPRPTSMHVPVAPEDDPALARANLVAGIVLFAVSLLLFAGTMLVALAYLALD
jgi:hypothetical protein